MCRVGRERVSGYTWLPQVDQTLVYQTLDGMHQSGTMVHIMLDPDDKNSANPI